MCRTQGSWKSVWETENGPTWPQHQHHPHQHPTHSGCIQSTDPSPSPSSSDTSSWQPAPFNSLQHLLGLANHWCSAPTMATTPAPSLVWPSHLGPYDGEFWGVSSYFPKQLKMHWKCGKTERKIRISVTGVKSLSCCVIWVCFDYDVLIAWICFSWLVLGSALQHPSM